MVKEEGNDEIQQQKLLFCITDKPKLAGEVGLKEWFGAFPAVLPYETASHCEPSDITLGWIRSCLQQWWSCSGAALRKAHTHEQARLAE